MKNKLFWPIVLVAVVVIIESVLLLSSKNGQKNDNAGKVEVTPTVAIEEKAVDFIWLKETTDKVTLTIKANKAVAIDAIDLYIGYAGGQIMTVNNLGDLPKPSFQKIRKEKTLVVLNYLISEA